MKKLILAAALAGLLCGCDYNDRIYREGMAKYYGDIAAGKTYGAAAPAANPVPETASRPRTFGIYDRYGNFRGTLRERAY